MKKFCIESAARRRFLKQASAAAISLGAGLHTSAASGVNQTREFTLQPKPGRVRLVPEPYEDTAVWSFNGSVPGPELRVRQGDRVKVVVENRLTQETTVHWHGLRIANAMDGVPHLTQPPISTGENFVYEFDTPDAGTFWYHPHQRSFEQVGRGLYGALIIEEHHPIEVDREVVWVLDDWRLQQSAEIADNFGSMHDISHAGRIGNTITVNGEIREALAVRQGERIRLRLINAANARIFGLEFAGHDPIIIAMDGQPVTPHIPREGRIVLAPAMRCDLVMDMTGNPGASYTVTDTYYPRSQYRLLDIVYDDKPLRGKLSDSPISLQPNPMAEPDLSQAVRHEITLAGGAMGSMTGAIMNDQWQDIRSMVRAGKAWAVNGIAATGHVMDPIVTIERGRPCLLRLVNDTAWPHPMHLHGHSFRVISRNGQPVQYQPWRDTVLLDRNEYVEVAFVADNPGDWMFHCHILEHQAAGMMAVIRVSA